MSEIVLRVEPPTTLKKESAGVTCALKLLGPEAAAVSNMLVFTPAELAAA